MALGLPSRMPGGAQTVRELIAAGERSFSFEFFPPKDAAGERQLWTTLRELEALSPTFVSVTYGAGGSTRDRTVAITERIGVDTSMTPMAHLTCVGHSRETLRRVVGTYAAAGVRNVLALRGDPPEGPSAPYSPHPGGLTYAVELVSLVKSLGEFCVGVAAFPESHPSAASVEADAQVLAAKARAGADFAITQLFFRAADYFALVDRVRALGVDIPIIPGIMPITNLAQITRMAALSGAALPAEVVERVSRFEDDPAAVRAEGIAIATELCDTLLAGDAPGLHFYTLNRSRATREIYAALTVPAQPVG
ncbi:MAG TPA: methylenetetrahydrofolate reductase [NAD(P)H] [Nocardioidaceae bacterium]|nr:methylenetetrahydrofolate reductase [NAD(P)H] [Nocardioidaceae bacterium]